MRVIYQHTGLLIVRHEGKEHAGLGHVVLVAETSRVTTFDASVDEENAEGRVVSLTAVSLFTGVGGLDIGLERAGFTTTLMCEADPWKRSVLAAHWPEVPIHDDVRTLLGERGGELPALPDLVHGGFPCQDVSVAGRRAGLAGERTGLFFDALRIVDTVRPRSVLLENVPGLLSSNDGRDFGVVLGELADRGYGVAWRILDAQHFGVPQRRRRVFVLALAGDDPRAAAERAGQVLALRESGSGHPAQGDEAGPRATAGTASGAGAGRVAHAPYLGADGRVNGAVTAKWAKGSGGPAGDEAYNLIAYRKSARVNADPDSAETWVDDGVANTLNTFDTGDVRTTHAIVEPAANGVRRLTPVECERLMGWPDDWTAPPGVKAPDTRRYIACGDGVVAPVAEWIGRRLAHALESHKCEGQAQWHGELDVQLGPEVGEEIEVDTGVRRGRAWVERSTFGRIEFRGSGDLEEYRPTR